MTDKPHASKCRKLGGVGRLKEGKQSKARRSTFLGTVKEHYGAFTVLSREAQALVLRVQTIL